MGSIITPKSDFVFMYESRGGDEMNVYVQEIPRGKLALIIDSATTRGNLRIHKIVSCDVEPTIGWIYDIDFDRV